MANGRTFEQKVAELEHVLREERQVRAMEAEGVQHRRQELQEEQEAANRVKGPALSRPCP